MSRAILTWTVGWVCARRRVIFVCQLGWIIERFGRFCPTFCVRSRSE
jgi:hypothetical protein